MEIDIGEHLNLFVGANNCGKSNLLRAVSLALTDWDDTGYSKEKDCPSKFDWAYSRITLVFVADRRTSVEKTMLKYAQEYEASANPRVTHASNNEIHLRVDYTPKRKVTFRIKGKGDAIGDRTLLNKCITQFRECLRFVYLKSGEGLGNFMKETLHEILETVLKEHLRDEFSNAEQARSDFVQMLGTGLLQEMGGHLTQVLQVIVPEIAAANILPQVPQLNDMLSSADILLKDGAETILLDKGTGIRGVVLVAFLRYLCEHSRRSMVIAIEEPESFLHPEAQMGVRKALEELASRNDISVLVTTHSPLMLSRKSTARISALKKNLEGETLLENTIQGDESHASVVSTLYGRSLLPYILEAILPSETTSDCVLIVEGYTDKFYIEHAMKITNNEGLLAGFEIRHSTGAHAAALDALLLRRVTGGVAKVTVLFDYDDEGKAARDLLKHHYKWGNASGKESILEYRKFRNTNRKVAVEAEDMYPAAILTGFVNKFGETVIEEKQQFEDGSFHYGLTQAAKDEFPNYIEEYVTASQVAKWIDLVRHVRTTLGLS
jgi:predicted ATP-dependent endonuclease of OLD family